MSLRSKLSGLLLWPKTIHDRFLIASVSTATRINYAIELDRAGRSQEAIAIYTDILTKDPNEVVAGVNLANVLIAQGRPGDATIVLAGLVDLFPNYSPLWCNLSSALSLCGEHERALEAAENAVKSDSGNANAYHNRAACRWKQGQHSGSILDWERAYRLAPQDIEIKEGLELARFAMQDKVLHMYGDVQHVRNSHGGVTVDGMEVAPTLQCPHCGGHFVPVRNQERARCRYCYDYICDSPECRECDPFRRRLDIEDSRLGETA